MTPTKHKALRRAAGLNQAQLAAALGLNQSTISRRESGEQPIGRQAEIALRAILSAKPKPKN